MIANYSFKKVAICHIGIDAGFFCEYSYMLEIMLYCLEHQIQFKLYSKDANFGYEKGWRDYFEPFCVEVRILSIISVIFIQFNQDSYLEK